jgi:brefeldin A-inhibited guanine nucleotide-exchange protein
LLENNIEKLSGPQWERVATTFVKLFRTTTPHQLFDESLRVEIDGNTSELLEASGMLLTRVLDVVLKRVL